jgi:hypothetical protein
MDADSYVQMQRHIAYPMLVEIKDNKLYGTFPDIDGLYVVAFTQEDLIHSAMDELLAYILNTDIGERKKPSDIIFSKREEFNLTKYSAVLLVPVVPEILYDPTTSYPRCFVDGEQTVEIIDQAVSKVFKSNDDNLACTEYNRPTAKSGMTFADARDIIRSIANDGVMTHLTPDRRDIEELDMGFGRNKELITLPEADSPIWPLLRELADMEITP